MTAIKDKPGCRRHRVYWADEEPNLGLFAWVCERSFALLIRLFARLGHH